MDLKGMMEIYLVGGIGLVSFLALLYSYIHKIRKITPELQEIKKDNEGFKEIIKNVINATEKSAQSSKELSKSIDSLNNVIEKFKDVEERNANRLEDIHKTVLKY